MKRLREILDEYKVLIGAVVATATVSAFVASGIAGEAKSQAESNASALEAVAKTQALLAETQQQIQQQAARESGKLESLLATLDLRPQAVRYIMNLPREPELDSAGRLHCPQAWLEASPVLDTVILWMVSDSCQVNAKMVYARPSP